MIDRIAKIICPEAWDRDEFQSIVERTNGGHAIGIDIEASMEEARNGARQTALEILVEMREPTEAMIDMGESFDGPFDGQKVGAETHYKAMLDAAVAEQPSPMDIAGESVAPLGLNNGVKR